MVYLMADDYDFDRERHQCRCHWVECLDPLARAAKEIVREDIKAATEIGREDIKIVKAFENKQKALERKQKEREKRPKAIMCLAECSISQKDYKWDIFDIYIDAFDTCKQCRSKAEE